MAPMVLPRGRRCHGAGLRNIGRRGARVVHRWSGPVRRQPRPATANKWAASSTTTSASSAMIVATAAGGSPANPWWWTSARAARQTGQRACSTGPAQAAQIRCSHDIASASLPTARQVGTSIVARARCQREPLTNSYPPGRRITAAELSGLPILSSRPTGLVISQPGADQGADLRVCARSDDAARRRRRAGCRACAILLSRLARVMRP